MKIECPNTRAYPGAQRMPGKVKPSNPSPGNSSRVGRGKRSKEEGQKRGNGLLRKWLLGFEDRDKNLDRAEDDKEDPGDKLSLGNSVADRRRMFEEEKGAASPREGLQGRLKDPALGRDPGK